MSARIIAVTGPGVEVRFQAHFFMRAPLKCHLFLNPVLCFGFEPRMQSVLYKDKYFE